VHLTLHASDLSNPLRPPRLESRNTGSTARPAVTRKKQGASKLSWFGRSLEALSGFSEFFRALPCHASRSPKRHPRFPRLSSLVIDPQHTYSLHRSIGTALLLCLIHSRVPPGSNFGPCMITVLCITLEVNQQKNLSMDDMIHKCFLSLFRKSGI